MDRVCKFIHSHLDFEKDCEIPTDSILDFGRLPKADSALQIKALLDKLVVVKSNGGLGSSMGHEGPKSLIKVRDGLTMLDLTVQQITFLNKTYEADVPLLLMNSPTTDSQTKEAIKQYSGVKILTLVQSSHLPFEPNHACCQNCQEDLCEVMHKSGLLAEMHDQGKRFVFLSNIDNLGATVEYGILMHLDGQSNDLSIFEVTERTRADIVEHSQATDDHLEKRQKLSSLHTGSLWMSLASIKAVMEERSVNIEPLSYNKTRDEGSRDTKLKNDKRKDWFKKCSWVYVPRSRFLPIAKTSDLTLVMSNLYKVKYGSLVMSPDRTFQTTPIINLGREHFGKISELQGRFNGALDIMDLDHLSVSGDVTFGKDVTLKGNIVIMANSGSRIDIPSGAILQDQVITGDLRIRDA